MKIFLSSQGETLDAVLDQRFGRCAYIVIYDTETKEHSIQENKYKDVDHAAGVKVAELAAENNIDIVITGQVGPKAEKTLKANDINFIFRKEDTISSIIDAYINKKQDLHL